jgi:hypothetical protein
MSSAAAARFLSEFGRRFVPTLMFSSITPVMQVMQNPGILETDEGRKEMLSMAAASIGAGAVGAGLGTIGTSLGNKFLPGPNALGIKGDVKNAYDTVNRISKTKTPIAPASALSEIDDAYQAGLKNIGNNPKRIEEYKALKPLLDNATTMSPRELLVNQQMPSEWGQNIGMMGDVVGGMAAWPMIYSAISGNGTNPVDPETVISPDDYTGLLQAQGYGSQEELIHQQVRARMLQGDQLPIYDYSPGTMFNTAGLNPVDILGYDPTQV